MNPGIYRDIICRQTNVFSFLSSKPQQNNTESGLHQSNGLVSTSIPIFWRVFDSFLQDLWELWGSIYSCPKRFPRGKRVLIFYAIIHRDINLPINGWLILHKANEQPRVSSFVRYDVCKILLVGFQLILSPNHTNVMFYHPQKRDRKVTHR